MKFKGTIIGEASGSVASLTFSHNRGGQYIRQRAVPVNPSSSFQQVVRNATAALTSLWGSTLTDAQREGWETYAANVLLPDSLGEPRNIGGLPQYVRSNVSRVQTALPRVDDPPTEFNLGAFTNPSISAVDATANEVDVAFDNADAWANEDDAALLVYASRPTATTVNFFKGPYRYAGKIDGDAIAPPISPASIALPFAVVAGQRVHFQMRVARADGRISAAIRFQGTAA